MASVKSVDFNQTYFFLTGGHIYSNFFWSPVWMPHCREHVTCQHDHDDVQPSCLTFKSLINYWQKC